MAFNLQGLTDFLASDQGRMMLTSAAGALNPNTQPVNKMIQNQIRTENQADLLTKLLGGQIPGGKASIDDKGMKMEIPRSMLNEGLNAPEGIGPDKSQLNMTGAMSVNPDFKLPTRQSGGGQFDPMAFASILAGMNPFSSGQLSSADLTGLTPEDIQGAFGTALQVKALQQQRIKDLYDNKYKQALIEQARANAAKARRGPEMSPFGDLTLEQFKALDDDTKAYSAYLATLPEDAEAMSRQEFVAYMDEPSKLKYLKAIADDPELYEKAIELSEAGSMKLSPYERTKQRRKAAIDVDRATAIGSREFFDDLDEKLEDVSRNYPMKYDKIFSPKKDPKASEKFISTVKAELVKSGADPNSIFAEWADKSKKSLKITYTIGGKEKSINVPVNY